MEWWQKALFSFGDRGEGHTTKWSCIICKDSQFSTEDEVQMHLKSHNLDEFQSLKFDVNVKGLKGEEWDTLSESVIDVSIDNSVENGINKDTVSKELLLMTSTEVQGLKTITEDETKKINSKESSAEISMLDGVHGEKESTSNNNPQTLPEQDNVEGFQSFSNHKRCTEVKKTSKKHVETCHGVMNDSYTNIECEEETKKKTNRNEHSYEHKREVKGGAEVDGERFAVKVNNSDGNGCIGNSFVQKQAGSSLEFQPTTFTRKSSRVKKRISLEDFESDIYNRNDGSFKHRSKSAKKMKKELKSVEEDEENQIVESRKESTPDTYFTGRADDFEKTPSPQRAGPIVTLTKRRGRPPKNTSNSDLSDLDNSEKSTVNKDEISKEVLLMKSTEEQCANTVLDVETKKLNSKESLSEIAVLDGVYGEKGSTSNSNPQTLPEKDNVGGIQSFPNHDECTEVNTSSDPIVTLVKRRGCPQKNTSQSSLSDLGAEDNPSIHDKTKPEDDGERHINSICVKEFKTTLDKMKQEITSDSVSGLPPSRGLVTGCGRGPGEAEAIEVLMNCLGKSVRHTNKSQSEASRLQMLIGDNTSTPKVKTTPKGKISMNVPLKAKNRLVFACDLCDWESSDHQSYHTHSLIHSDMQPVRCWYCDQTIDVSKLNNANNEFKCEVCEETFPQNAKLAQHIKDTGHHFTSKNYSSVIDLDNTCFLCSLSLASGTELDLHLRCVHADVMCHKTEDEIRRLKQSMKPSNIVLDSISDFSHFVCHICEWKTKRHFNFHRHMLTHTLGKNYKCTYCAKVICADNSKTGYGQKIHKCADCEQIFHTKLKYKIHRFQVHGETSKGSRQCSICGFVTRSKREISKHHMLAHGTKKFDKVTIIPRQKEKKVTKTLTVCNICGYSSDRKDIVLKHRLTHIPPEQREVYQCEQCNFSSYVMSSLNMHISIKHREKKSVDRVLYKCDLCTEYTCDSKEDLLKHKHNCINLFDENQPDKPGDIPEPSTDEPPTCVNKQVEKDLDEPNLTDDDQVELDTSGFTVQKKKKSNLQEVEVRYVCDVCELHFTRIWNLKRHKEMSHDREKFQCDRCEYVTKSAKNLARHYDYIHSVEPPDGVKPPKEDPFQTKERLQRRKLSIRPVRAYKKIASLKTEERVSCEYCGLEVNEYTLKGHINRRHLKLYKCSFPECLFSSAALDDIKGHIVQNHLQEDTVTALQLLNELCSKETSASASLPGDPTPNVTTTTAVEFALLMCIGCRYRTPTIDDMITHKSLGTESCGSAVLKLAQAHTLSQCSHCGFHPSSVQESLQHQIETCLGKDLYDINELIRESEETVYELVNVPSLETTSRPHTGGTITQLYPVTFLQHSDDGGQIPVEHDPAPSYTAALNQTLPSGDHSIQSLQLGQQQQLSQTLPSGDHSIQSLQLGQQQQLSQTLPSGDHSIQSLQLGQQQQLSQTLPGGDHSIQSLQLGQQQPMSQNLPSGDHSIQLGQQQQLEQQLIHQKVEALGYLDSVTGILKDSVTEKCNGVNLDMLSYTTDTELRPDCNRRNETDPVNLTESELPQKAELIHQYEEMMNENTDILGKSTDTTHTTECDDVDKQKMVHVMEYGEMNTVSDANNTTFVRRLFADNILAHSDNSDDVDEIKKKSFSNSADNENGGIKYEESNHESQMNTLSLVESEEPSCVLDLTTTDDLRLVNNDKVPVSASDTVEGRDVECGNRSPGGVIDWESTVTSITSPGGIFAAQDGTDKNETEDSQQVIVVDKKNDELTFITVPNGENDICFEIRGQLNVNADGELPANLYSFISQVLEKQRNGATSSGVVYCDIIVDNDD